MKQTDRHQRLNTINSFSTNVPLLYPLKKSENLRFYDILREVYSEKLVENGLIHQNCPVFLKERIIKST